MSSFQICIARRAAASSSVAAASTTPQRAPPPPPALARRTTAAARPAHHRRRAQQHQQQQQRCNAAAAQQQESSSKPQTVQVVFTREDAAVDAAVGEPLADVASRAGVDSIQYGCHAGNCGICEVELRRFEEDGGGGDNKGDGTTVVVRACVAVVPANCRRVEVDLLDDGLWGLDGFDT